MSKLGYPCLPNHAEQPPQCKCACTPKLIKGESKYMNDIGSLQHLLWGSHIVISDCWLSSLKLMIHLLIITNHNCYIKPEAACPYPMPFAALHAEQVSFMPFVK